MKTSMKTIMMTFAAATMMIGTAYAQTPTAPAKAVEAAPASKAAMAKPAAAVTPAVTPAATEKASAPASAAASSAASAAASSVKAPRDAASGQATGKRQHQPGIKGAEAAPASTPEASKPPVKK